MTDETRRELEKLVFRIERYPKGFEFTVFYRDIPTKPKRNGMNWVLKKAQERGFIESISVGHTLEELRGESDVFIGEETFKRL